MQQDDQRWNSCFNEPSAGWRQRKCNSYMNFFCIILCLTSETPKCGIPLSMWLSVCFVFHLLENLGMEARERMRLSIYWSERRGLRKFVTGSIGGLKEIGEMAWMIYGLTLYFSPDSDGCSDENVGFMVIMVLFLILAACKILLIIVVIIIMCLIYGGRRLQRR